MTEREQKIRKLILEIAVAKGRAMEYKMYKTFYKLDEAINTLGWELAEMLEKEK